MDAFINLITSQGPAWMHGLDVVSIFRGVIIALVLAVGVVSQWQASRQG